MNPSPYDRTVAFVGARYRRNPVVSSPSSGLGWFLRAREVILGAGSGLIVAAGVVWLADIIRRGD